MHYLPPGVKVLPSEVYSDLHSVSDIKSLIYKILKVEDYVIIAFRPTKPLDRYVSRDFFIEQASYCGSVPHFIVEKRQGTTYTIDAAWELMYGSYSMKITKKPFTVLTSLTLCNKTKALNNVSKYGGDVWYTENVLMANKKLNTKEKSSGL